MVTRKHTHFAFLHDNTRTSHLSCHCKILVLMVLIIEACKEKPPSFFRIVLNQFLTTPGHKTVHNLALFHQINFFQASSFSLHGFSSDGAMHLIK